jgi:HEAT repeat protein
VAALGRALERARGQDAELLIHCLAATRSAKAVAPLAGAMERAWRQGRGEPGREAVRALARLGCAEAATPLAELLVQRSLRHRRTLRELKTAAAAALGALPGDEAVGALAQAAGAKDASVRRAARSALERRANTRGTRSLI